MYYTIYLNNIGFNLCSLPDYFLFFKKINNNRNKTLIIKIKY